MTLSEEQEDRLQILRDLAELTTTKRLGGSESQPPFVLIAMADWILSGEPSNYHLASPFDTTLENLLSPVAVDAPNTYQVIVHSIAEDGLPPIELQRGRVAFIHEGRIISGSPLPHDPTTWKIHDDILHGDPINGIDYWVEFTTPIWEMAR